MAERPPTVLLVDDEAENLIVLEALLDRDYRVLTARSAAEALEALAREPVDVLITDQRMPGASGVELVKETRLLHPDVVRIVLTAYTDVDVLLAAVNEGSVYAYVIKPWSVDQMRATIRRAVDWGRMRKEHGELAAELARANRELTERNAELARVRERMLLEEKLAAVGRFAAEMVHEMSTHLQVLDMLIGILGEDLEGEARATVEELQTQTEQLIAIVKDIRQYAGGGRLEPKMSRVEPKRLLDQVVRMCRRIPALLDVGVVVDAAEVGPFWLDRHKMMHLLANLLRNAMQASPKGETVRINLKLDGEQLVVVVEDRGPGIPPALREKVFEPFFTTRGEAGTGLGLTICRWVAEMHGGRIEVSTAPGGGARFTVVLPRLAAPSGYVA